MPKKYLVIIPLIAGLFAVAYFITRTQRPPELPKETAKPVNKPSSETYKTQETEPKKETPVIDPSKFTTKIDNKYFSLPVGRKLIFEGQTEDGLERIEITITGQTKKILGVETLVYTDKVWVDGELVEDTRDYLAQDLEGNVWYFGEDVDNYEDGKLLDHEGAWLAGVDQAEPGIWIKAKHLKGDSYKQEYYKGKAEDMRDVVSVGEPVTIKLGSYKDCVKMYDWTPLDKESREHKIYCSEVGALVQEINLVSGEKVELKEIK